MSAILEKTKTRCRAAVLGALFLGLAACSPTYRNYGYVPPQEDLDQIVVGIDTRASVEETLGSAAAASAFGDQSMYFVRSRVRTIAMLEPEVIEREVVAVSFDDNEVVRNVEKFGLEDGQVVRLSRRVTESSVANSSIIRQLLRNIGQFTPGGVESPS